jgi:hypothetical protein
LAFEEFGRNGDRQHVCLLRGLDNQDHAWAKGGNVPVISFQGGDRGSVSCGNRIESFAGLHRVPEHAG